MDTSSRKGWIGFSQSLNNLVYTSSGFCIENESKPKLT